MSMFIMAYMMMMQRILYIEKKRLVIIRTIYLREKVSFTLFGKLSGIPQLPSFWLVLHFHLVLASRSMDQKRDGMMVEAYLLLYFLSSLFQLLVTSGKVDNLTNFQKLATIFR